MFQLHDDCCIFVTTAGGIEVVVPVEDIHDLHVAPNTTAMFEVLFVNSTDGKR